jgi:hypothetical protein
MGRRIRHVSGDAAHPFWVVEAGSAMVLGYPRRQVLGEVLTSVRPQEQWWEGIDRLERDLVPVGSSKMHWLGRGVVGVNH